MAEMKGTLILKPTSPATFDHKHPLNTTVAKLLYQFPKGRLGISALYTPYSIRGLEN